VFNALHMVLFKLLTLQNEKVCCFIDHIPRV
jgi:hypothetical protein